MIAKFFIILSSLLALISNSMSLRTIGPLRVVRSSRIFTDCSLFSEDTVDCAPFFSNEESQPDEFCCSAFDYAASMDTQCICDMIGNHNSALSFNKISTLCRVTLPCDSKLFRSPLNLYVHSYIYIYIDTHILYMLDIYIHSLILRTFLLVLNAVKINSPASSPGK